MAITVVSKPSGFQPVGGGDLFYVFTEASLIGKPNYRLELEFNGLNLPKFQYRPDSNLTITCNIAAILASVLTLSKTVANRYKSTYVKYQAVWDFGSDAQVLLSGDVIDFYCGNNHYLNARTKFDVGAVDFNPIWALATGKALAHSGQRLTDGRPATFEFLCDGTLPVNARLIWYATNASSIFNIAVFDGSVRGLKSIDFTISPIVSGLTDGVGAFIIVDNAYNNGYCYVPTNWDTECSNPFYIRWINDFGGLWYKMFDYDQQLNLLSDDLGKNLAKNIVRQLGSYAEWVALSELKRKDDTYNDNYKVGQFVEDVTTYATPLPLVVDSQATNTNARRYGHQIALSFRYGLIPNNRVSI